MAGYKTMKICIKCKENKEESDYSLRPEGVLFNTCKECKRKYSRELHRKKSKSLEWRVYRSEMNKQLYKRKKNEQQ